jgi:hypothetical protein
VKLFVTGSHPEQGGPERGSALYISTNRVLLALLTLVGFSVGVKLTSGSELTIAVKSLATHAFGLAHMLLRPGRTSPSGRCWDAKTDAGIRLGFCSSSTLTVTVSIDCGAPGFGSLLV